MYGSGSGPDESEGDAQRVVAGGFDDGFQGVVVMMDEEVRAGVLVVVVVVGQEDDGGFAPHLLFTVIFESQGRDGQFLAARSFEDHGAGVAVPAQAADVDEFVCLFLGGEYVFEDIGGVVCVVVVGYVDLAPACSGRQVDIREGGVAVGECREITDGDAGMDRRIYLLVVF